MAQERFSCEWSTIHVAQMLTSRSVMKLFRRYVQHYNLLGVTSDMPVHPLGEYDYRKCNYSNS
jgi:hypothetical protein